MLYCVTTSCCSIGSFGVDIFSDKTCTYLVTGKRVTVINLKNNDGTNYREKEIEIKTDITLIDKDNSLETEGLESVMKAGLYQVIDGEVAFEPSVQKIRVKAVCVACHHQGTFLGHSYDFTTSLCILPSMAKRPSKEYSRRLCCYRFSKEKRLIQLAKENDDTLVFDEDIILEDKYVIKAGRYLLDEGKIYTRNIELK